MTNALRRSEQIRSRRGGCIWNRGLPTFIVLLALARGASAADTPPPVAEKLKIAMLDIVPNGARPELASTLGSIVATKLQRLQVFSIVTNQDLRAILSHEALEQMAGCETNGGCTAPGGAMLGARYLLSGLIGQVNNTLALNLVLTDLQTGHSVGRSSANISDAAKLTEETERAAAQVVAPLLADRQGVLLVTSTEKGAAVKVDGDVLGVTPLPRKPITWGPHEIRIEKEGFVAGIEDVTVTGSDVIERHFELIPSPDFVRSYEQSARTMRILAWVATGAAVAALVGTIYFQVDYLEGNTQYQNAYSQYNQSGPNAAAQYESLAQQRAKLVSASSDITGLGVATGALAATAIVLWVVGADPERYARYREAAAEAPSKAGELAFHVGEGGLAAATVTLP